MQHQVRAFAMQAAGDRRSDALRAACDEHNFP